MFIKFKSKLYKSIFIRNIYEFGGLIMSKKEPRDEEDFFSLYDPGADLSLK